jgi:hypothetical protein
MNKRPVTQRRIRLANWIKEMEGKPEWGSLRECLEQVAAGKDANKVFGLNRGRGRNDKQAIATFRKNMISMWVVSDMLDNNHSRKAAIENAAKAWGVDYETVARYAQRLDGALDTDGNFDYDALLPKT